MTRSGRAAMTFADFDTFAMSRSANVLSASQTERVGGDPDGGAAQHEPG
jgi:hypothetical protein